MQENRSPLLLAGPLILHENARPHITDVVTKKLRDYGWEVLPHAPRHESTRLSLIPKVKRICVCGRNFSSLEELSTDATVPDLLDT